MERLSFIFAYKEDYERSVLNDVDYLLCPKSLIQTYLRSTLLLRRPKVS